MSKTRLVQIWSLYILLILGGLGFVLFKGFKIDTDFLGIFPKHQERGGFYQANALYEKNFENELLIFVKSSTADKALAEATLLAKQMSEQPIFSSAKSVFADQKQNEWVSYLYSKRLYLLTQDQIKDIEMNQGRTLVQRSLQNLYSPVSVTTQFKTDPLNLFQDYFLQTSANFLLRPYQGYLVVEDPDGTAVFLRATVNHDLLSTNESLIHFYEKTKLDLASRGHEVFFLGAPLFTAFGSEKSMQEVSLYGTLSFVGVILLLIWSFSSVIPVIASLLTIAISVLSGLVAVMLVYSSTHILSILLGISVLGIVTDYCTHFFSKGFDSQLKSNDEVIQKIKGALGMGLLTNVLTYICFYFTDLVLLKQLAIFTIVGILTTYITVLAVFPRLRFRRLHVGVLGKASALSSVWQRFGPYKSISVIGVVVAIALFSLGGLRFDDDVRLLQNVDVGLKADEAKVLSYLGARKSASYFIIQANSSEELLKQEELLRARLQASSYKAIAVSNFVPSPDSQTKSLEAFKKLKAPLKDFYINLGLKNSFNSIDSILKIKPTQARVADLFARSTDFPLAPNWLGEINQKHYSVVNVVGNPAYVDLQKLQNDNFHLFNKAIDVSYFIQTLRETITEQFVYVLIALCVALFVIWGWRRALFILFPPLISAAATLALVLMYAGYLNLFNILAVILIFCLGMDYSVFFSQSKDSTAATHVGILISFLSTIGSFGVLALSSTYAVSSFGLTVFIGICMCYLLSPLAAWGDHD